MTTLAHPKRLRWKAWFQPVRVSPNGKRVVGVATTRNGRLSRTVQVRRLSNGRVTNSYAFSGGGVDARTPAWQGSTAVVFQAGVVNDEYPQGDPLTFTFEPGSRAF